MLLEHEDFPLDLFTMCLIDPIRVSIRWFLHLQKFQRFSRVRNNPKGDSIEEDYAYRLEGDPVIRGNVEREVV